MSPPHLRANTTLAVLREATRDAHERLETRFDAVSLLASPDTRMATIEAYAAMHDAAERGLEPLLGEVEGLSFDERRRRELGRYAHTHIGPAFPTPTSRPEALGLLYVIEGSTLGGRIIRRTLAGQGIDEAILSFLDPYGDRAGEFWKNFVSVLERETGGSEEAQSQAMRGAVCGFAFAEQMLCGEVAR
ncbi:MAG: biliverdin-producing heme oxygenase [Rhizobiaceae bacterium]|nr:biliverdin-producing heme oxygenase [Rhizobiaceae bacterium]